MLKLPKPTSYYRPRRSDRIYIDRRNDRNIASKGLTITEHIPITDEQRTAAYAYLQRHDALDLAAILGLEGEVTA